ncbi:hypothetical protein CEXT_600611 [Caerostris extrusa]|uniref:Uncharacterized protein n=1 Tax=Caerostris extrusa TaxID=172846 RepID=A0AAV4XXZ4_CAEEX|nr:hypothetical protein CEXT_600611 [Caerostris extrusa]
MPLTFFSLTYRTNIPPVSMATGKKTIWRHECPSDPRKYGNIYSYTLYQMSVLNFAEMHFNRNTSSSLAHQPHSGTDGIGQWRYGFSVKENYASEPFSCASGPFFLKNSSPINDDETEF